MDQTPEQKLNTERAAWGDGRIAYAAHASRIQQLMTQGWPLKKIYRELQDQLTGLSYQQFTYHVRKQTPKTATPPILAADTRDISQPETIERGMDEQKQESSRTTGKRFTPGPRIPDPSQLY